MKRHFSSFRFSLLASLFLLAAAMTSCSESDDTVEEYVNWETRNYEYFENIYQQAKTAIDGGDLSWVIIKSYSKPDGLTAYTAGADIDDLHTNYIVAHVITTGEGTESPLQTDSVRVHYRGWLLPSTSYPEGKQFDSSWQGNYDLTTMVPAKFSVTGNINGFATALMSMHVGDRWEVYIPWQLGYGTSSSSSSIPNCSTLRFDITLHSFSKPGKAMPPFK